MRVDRLFKCLAQQILAHFGIGDMLKNRKHDVIADQTLGSAEKTEVAHDHAFFIFGKGVRLP